MLSFVICSAVLLFAGAQLAARTVLSGLPAFSRGEAALLQESRADYGDETYLISSAFKLRNLPIHAFCWRSDHRSNLPVT
jgi:hypothetical protein